MSGFEALSTFWSSTTSNSWKAWVKCNGPRKSCSKGNQLVWGTHFLMANMILSSHSDVRVPIISGIVKIRALGKGFFKQLHNEYVSPETWAKAREILASCPTQHDLSTARLDHWEGCSDQCQQARQSWFISLLAKMGYLIFYFGHHTGQAHEEQEEDPRVKKSSTSFLSTMLPYHQAGGNSPSNLRLNSYKS